jgi:hypothetical protein
VPVSGELLVPAGRLGIGRVLDLHPTAEGRIGNIAAPLVLGDDALEILPAGGAVELRSLPVDVIGVEPSYLSSNTKSAWSKASLLRRVRRWLAATLENGYGHHWIASPQHLRSQSAAATAASWQGCTLYPCGGSSARAYRPTDAAFAVG